MTLHTLETIGTVFPKLTCVSVYLGEDKSIVPFCRIVADRLVELCILGRQSKLPNPSESVVMRALTKLDISGIPSCAASTLSFPELVTLRALNDGDIWRVLTNSPKLAHCAFVSPIDSQGMVARVSRKSLAVFATRSKARAAPTFPLVTQLHVQFYAQSAGEIEAVLAMFPNVRWVDVLRACYDGCGVLVSVAPAVPCIDAGTAGRFRGGVGIGVVCRDRLVSMIVSRMPALREMYVSPLVFAKNSRVHVRLADIQLLGLDHLVPRYCDGLQGSAQVLVDEHRPWDRSVTD